MEEMQTRPSAPFQGGESPLAATDPEWVAITTAFAGQEVPAASPLTEKERMLCILAALLGCQGMGAFRKALGSALDAGVEPVAIREVIYQATAYLGIGRVQDFLAAANEVMAQHGIRLPLPAQGTTDVATRFDKGLAKQVSLFGEGMAKVQTDGPAARRGCENQLRGHTRGNLGVGNGKARLYAFVEQCMPYIGYPRTLNAMNIVDEVTGQAQ